MSETIESPAAPTNTVVAVPVTDKEVGDARERPPPPQPTRTKYTLWHPGCLTKEQVFGKPPKAAAPAPVNVFPPAQLLPRCQLSCELSPAEQREATAHELAEDGKTRPLMRTPVERVGSQGRRWAVRPGVPNEPCPPSVRLLGAVAEEQAEEVQDVTDDRWLAIVLGCCIALLSVALVVAVFKRGTQHKPQYSRFVVR
jgi:hypothetical protein